jgi:hypothetical protein
MCMVIDMRTRRVVRNTALPGMIDVYRRAGKVGLDACVPATIAAEIPELERIDVWEADGMVSFDIQLPPVLAAKVLRQAKRAGVSVRR